MRGGSAVRSDRVVGRVYWMPGCVGSRLGVTIKNRGLNTLCMSCGVEHRQAARPKCAGLCRKHYEMMLLGEEEG